MDLHAQIKHLKKELKRSEHIQNELDRRIFFLKTLYDVSKDIFSSVESETILRSFLLMAMGNFGTSQGFILVINSASKEIQHIVEVGVAENDIAGIKNGIESLIQQELFSEAAIDEAKILPDKFLPSSCGYSQFFTVESDCPGIFGLGPKLIGDPYNEDDRELLDTLKNNLIVALTNARSFEKINKLNQDLRANNIQLEKALSELKVALRKVEILESIKSNLCKFLPAAVGKLIEQTPAGEALEARLRDVTVLFLDIEGYTKITEDVGATEATTIVEKYFSVFMDAIYENNGDVVSTAGDGLMVLFMTEDEALSALEALKAAQTIRENTSAINQECSLDSEPVVINIGICSGQALVGAAKFDSYTGSRWTYSPNGTTVNVAARICSHATGGAVLLSRSTAERAKDKFSIRAVGKYNLKNLSEKVEIFELNP